MLGTGSFLPPKHLELRIFQTDPLIDCLAFPVKAAPLLFLTWLTVLLEDSTKNAPSGPAEIANVTTHGMGIHFSSH